MSKRPIRNKNLFKKETGISDAMSLEMRKKMEEAINEGFSSKDPKVRAHWDELFGEGNRPTMEEFIKKLVYFMK